MNGEHIGEYRRLLVIGALTAHLAVLLEWLRLVTMKSFLDAVPWSVKVETLVASSGLASLFMLAAVALAIGVVCLVGRVVGRTAALYLPSLIPGGALALLALLLVDNFSYTILGLGVVSLKGPWRAAAAIGLLALAIQLTRWVRARAVAPARDLLMSPAVLASIAGWQVALLVIVGWHLAVGAGSAPFDPHRAARRPNVILIGPDGVNADHMSLYGYTRPTTPFMDRTAPTALVAENAFVNGTSSQMSIMTMLTGKTAATVGVANAMGILRGADAYEHLPGFFREQGYYTVQLGVPDYIDARMLNLRRGFDLTNGTEDRGSMLADAGRFLRVDESAYFLSRVLGRLVERLRHIFYLVSMENTFKLVTHVGGHAGARDDEKVAQLLAIVAERREPVFAQVHLMCSHGPSFYVKSAHFAVGEQQTTEWMTDFYDDAILSFDSDLERIVQALTQSGKLDNTLIIVYSDHNMAYRSDQRSPLVFYFPGGAFAGRVRGNSQNLDVAPTVLDYMGLPIPGWMEGQSLLRGEPPLDRVILSGTKDVLRLVYCNHWFEFNATGYWWQKRVIPGHTTSCPGEADAARESIPAPVLDLVKQYGWEVRGGLLDIDMSVGRITRSDIAVGLLAAMHGGHYQPPPAQGLFEDVPPSVAVASWIEEAYREGVVEACQEAPPRYCPAEFVTRGKAAEYLLKAREGKAYLPPEPFGVFADVPRSSHQARWIEDLYARKITNGCSTSPLQFCPDNLLIRSHLDAFLKKTFPQG